MSDRNFRNRYGAFIICQILNALSTGRERTIP